MHASLTQSAKRLEESEVIAIVLPDQMRVELAGSAWALAAGLRSLGKAVSIFAPSALPSRGLVPWGVIETDGEPLREFIISFDLGRSPIKELRYERDSERLDIILSPSGNRIRREDVGFRYGPLRYDLALTLGVISPEAAAESVARVPELLHEKPIVNIDVEPANTLYGELNCILAREDGSGATIPEAIYEILSSLNALPKDAETSGALLTALAAATRGFRPPETGAETFRIAGELIRQGANLDEALRLAFPFRPIEVEKLAARAIVRSRRDDEGNYWMLLTAEDVARTTGDPSAIESVFAIAHERFPDARRTALLIQNPASEGVRAFLAARDPAELGDLAERATGEVRDGYMAFPEIDASFRAAEERIHALLRDTGAVE